LVAEPCEKRPLRRHIFHIGLGKPFVGIEAGMMMNKVVS